MIPAISRKNWTSLKKIKNNISITNKGNQLYEKFFGIPIEIKEDMQENYKIVYDNGEVEYGI